MSMSFDYFRKKGMKQIFTQLQGMAKEMEKAAEGENIKLIAGYTKDLHSIVSDVLSAGDLYTQMALPESCPKCGVFLIERRLIYVYDSRAGEDISCPDCHEVVWDSSGHYLEEEENRKRTGEEAELGQLLKRGEDEGRRNEPLLSDSDIPF